MTNKRQPTATPKIKTPELPLLIIKTFYTDDDNIRPELLDTEAKLLGKAFATEKPDHYVSSTQIRRFYGDVKQLQYKIEKYLKDNKFPIDSKDSQHLRKYLPLIKMIKAKVAYARRAGTAEKVSKSFKDTIDNCIELIKTPRDFYTFVLFFEAIIGYYYYYEAGGEQ